MHVLITADAIGGVWTYVRELVSGLLRRNTRVTLVSFGEIPTPRQMEWMEGLGELDFRPTGFQLEWMQDAENDLELSTEYLASVIREVKPDIVHFNQYCYGAMDLDVPKLVVAHSDVVSWWVAVHGEGPRETRWFRWYRETVLRGLQGANAVVAPSEWMLDAVSSYFAKPAQAEVIYNGRTPALLNPHITKEEYAVSVGRLWDAGKQISLLTQMDHPPIPVHIAGADEHPEAALRGQKRQSKKNKIQFRGQMTEGELRQLYSRAAIYAATSRYEPFGLAPLEAALSRCALVLNDIPSFHELWGENACYFRYNDAGSLRSTLQRLVEDSESRIAYANLAYNHARQRFTADQMVSRYLDLYQSLVRAEVKAA